jgi:hypothetical protein
VSHEQSQPAWNKDHLQFARPPTDYLAPADYTVDESEKLLISRISDAAGRWADENHPEGLPNGFLTIGFLDPDIDEVEERELGVIVYDFQPEAALSESVRWLELDDVKVPIVDRIVRYEPHLTLTAPQKSGMAACWAEGGLSEVDRGWLTARHVVSDSDEHVLYGQPVTLSGADSLAGSGQVIRAAPGGIDAALVHCHCASDDHRHELAYVRPDVGLGVEFATSVGTIQKAKVSGRPQKPKLIGSPQWPQKFTMDHTGNKSDSGSLIRIRHSGPAVGIYLAGIVETKKNGTEKYEGVGLSIEQVMAVMDVRIFT